MHKKTYFGYTYKSDTFVVHQLGRIEDIEGNISVIHEGEEIRIDKDVFIDFVLKQRKVGQK